MLRRNIPVRTNRQPKIGESVRITHSPSDAVAPAWFELRSGIEVIADCASAKRLSDWAFEHGAAEVRHDYDCKLSDGEP